MRIQTRTDLSSGGGGTMGMRAETADADLGSPEGTGLVLASGTPGKASTETTSMLAEQHKGVQVMTLPGGFVVPMTVKSMSAGSMALANGLALALQNKQIDQATFDKAMAALTPTPQ